MSMCTVIPKDDPVSFLVWLYRRLKNKFHEEDIVLASIANIINNYTIVKTKFDIDFVDRLCAKHFIEYDIGSDNESFYGFTEDFKRKLNNLVLDAIKQTGSKIKSENVNIDFNINL